MTLYLAFIIGVSTVFGGLSLLAWAYRGDDATRFADEDYVAPYADDLAWQRLLMAVEGVGPATAAYIARHEAEWVDVEWAELNEGGAA